MQLPVSPTACDINLRCSLSCARYFRQCLLRQTPSRVHNMVVSPSTSGRQLKLCLYSTTLSNCYLFGKSLKVASLAQNGYSMDPASVLGIACGVHQLLGISFKVIATCQRLYHDAYNDPVNDLYESVTALDETTSALIALLDSSALHDEITHPDRQLYLLASNSSKTAQRLLSTLEPLKLEDKPKRREAFRIALKTAFKQREIQEVQKQFQIHQQMMQTGLIIDMRYVVRIKGIHPLTAG